MFLLQLKLLLIKVDTGSTRAVATEWNKVESKKGKKKTGWRTGDEWHKILCYLIVRVENADDIEKYMFGWERVIICTNTRVVTYRVVITRHQRSGQRSARCGAVHLHVITLSCLCIDARWMDGWMDRPSLVAMPKRKLLSNRKLLGLQLRLYTPYVGRRRRRRRCFAAMIKRQRRRPRSITTCARPGYAVSAARWCLVSSVSTWYANDKVNEKLGPLLAPSSHQTKKNIRQLYIYIIYIQVGRIETKGTHKKMEKKERNGGP